MKKVHIFNKPTVESIPDEVDIMEKLAVMSSPEIKCMALRENLEVSPALHGDIEHYKITKILVPIHPTPKEGPLCREKLVVIMDDDVNFHIETLETGVSNLATYFAEERVAVKKLEAEIARIKRMSIFEFFKYKRGKK